MKQRSLLVSPLGYIKLSQKPVGKGIQFADRYYLHNDYSVIESLISDAAIASIGTLEQNALRSSHAFLYEIREIETGDIEKETLAYLVKVNEFCLKLWFVGDISIELEQSFCIRPLHVHKNFLGHHFSGANGRLSDKTLNLDCLKKIRPFLRGDQDEELIRAVQERNVQSTHFSKKGDRIGRAFSFVCAARSVIQLHLKIVFYCGALECLFSTQSSELSHQIAERSSWYCASSPEARLVTYKLVKRAYRFRSKIVHGSSLTKADEEANVEISEGLDALLRAILSSAILRHDSVFGYPDDKLDGLFLNLTLGAGISPAEDAD